MSSDDDAEELAAMRAQRAARMGGAATLSELRELQRQAEEADAGSRDFFDVSARVPARTSTPSVGLPRPPQHQLQAEGGRRSRGRGGEDDDDAEWAAKDEDGADSQEGEEREEEGGGEGRGAQQGAGGWSEVADRMDDPVRAQLPMSFGQQEVKVANPITIHNMFRRSASPPQPLPPPSSSSSLPPPPGDGRSRGRPGGVHGARSAGPGAAGTGTGASYGPPRPPARRPDAAGGDAAAAGGSGGVAFGPPRPPPRGGIVSSSGDEAAKRWKGPEEEGEQPEVGPPQPPGYGEGGGEQEEEEEEEEPPLVGPPRPPPGSEEEEEDGGSDDADEPRVGVDDGDEDDDPYGLPITHEAVLKGHTKAVSCLDLEHSGTRMVTGSYDYTVRLYDFHGMKSDMRSFRELEPSDGHPVLSLSWSPSGDAFLVVTGAAQAKIYDRDGRALGEFVRGDMYIRDARNTKGHISGLTGGWWNPSDRYTAITSSEDGTVRIWDTHNVMQKTVIKPALARPVRTAVTAVSYNTTGSLIGAGLADGTLQVWSVGGKFGVSAAVGQVLPPKPQMVEKQGWTYVSKPNQLVRDAHESGTEITSLCFSSDNHTLLSRGMDGTLKIWDLRRFRVPVCAHNNLPVAYAQTRAIFSPDESLILTGTGGTGGPSADGGGEGSVVIFNRDRNELIRKVGMPGNVTALAWHHRLNQLFVGLGNRKSGETRALYDLTRSERGVVAAASRRPRPPNPLDFTPPVLIKTPHALPMFREDPAKKRKAEREAMKARRPDPGMVAGRGKQGRLGATGGTLLTQHLLKQRGGLLAPEHEMDPREAILRHSDKAKEEFSAWTAAYRATQPKPLYAREQDDDETDE